MVGYSVNMMGYYGGIRAVCQGMIGGTPVLHPISSSPPVHYSVACGWTTLEDYTVASDL